MGVMQIRPYWIAYMIRRSVVEPLPFLGTQKAKRAGLIASKFEF